MSVYQQKKNAELSSDLKWITGSYHKESTKIKNEVKIPNHCEAEAGI